MASHRIAVLPGDGIGQEVIAAGTEVLRALAAREPELERELVTFDWGSAWFRAQATLTKLPPMYSGRTLSAFSCAPVTGSSPPRPT